MEDAAVVSGLMTTGGVFFFQNRDGAAGELAQQLVGSGEADDASTDDKHVLVLGLGHGVEVTAGQGKLAMKKDSRRPKGRRD